MSLLNFQRRAKQQIQEHVSSLLALVRKQTSACEIRPCECHEYLHQAENRIVGETTEKYGYCGCNVRLVILKVDPDYQQREERVIAKWLLDWFIRASELEKVPLFTITNVHSSGLALGTEMGAEEAGTYSGTEPYFISWMADPADPDVTEREEEDRITGVSFIMWKAPEDSVHCSKE